ncbi:hypothetical protein C8R44DRAFT_714991 [Mycena epipterygia]|nr:hypothetical protein C8R44DRAFT_714991 [Mycena epipterygia]
MTGISLVAVSMATVVLESLLYGLLLVLFSTNLYLRITRYARPREFVARGNLWWNPIVLSSIAIFMICTAHWIITVERFFRAFLGPAGDPLLFYMDASQPTSVVSNTLAIAAALVGDVAIIHRLWIIWSRDLRVICLPVLSWLGALTCGIAIVYVFTQSTPTNNKLLAADDAWVTAYWALTTLINIYCTAFIAWRIWKTSRATPEVGGGLMMPVFVILIESAAIWTAWAIFFAVTYLTHSTLQFIVRDLTAPILGLVNLLIHLRVGLGWSRAEAPDASGAPMTSSASMFAVNLPTENDEYLESVSATEPTSSKSGS